MAIRPGTLNDFSGSMAAAIESELNASLLLDGLPALPTGPADELRERRRLFVAIARGVIRHLRDNQVSIRVTYLDNGVTRTTNATLEVTGL
ncbi:MAG: hypothetical protein SNJ63_07865 [Sphingomonadaceae bacterium]